VAPPKRINGSVRRLQVQNNIKHGGPGYDLTPRNREQRGALASALKLAKSKAGRR
jgi:hypothetical protein